MQGVASRLRNQKVRTAEERVELLPQFLVFGGRPGVDHGGKPGRVRVPAVLRGDGRTARRRGSGSPVMIRAGKAGHDTVSPFGRSRTAESR